MRRVALVVLGALVAQGCGGADGEAGDTEPAWQTRSDGAKQVALALGGSLQNACFSPDSKRIAFTQWTQGYNEGPPAIVHVADVETGSSTPLTSWDGLNVNMPGSCWSAVNGLVTYASDQPGHEEIFTILASGGDPTQITSSAGGVAFEPVWSPDGAWIAFELHADVAASGDSPGQIYKIRATGTELTLLSDGTADDRQPNWSAAGDKILFQSNRTGNLDIFTINPDGSELTNITNAPSEDTDACFSPDGKHILYSSNFGGLELANLFVVPAAGGDPVRVTRSPSYDGAPAWSPDGKLIAFESRAGDPDGSPGTQIWTVAAPNL